jgi:peptidoglycan/xylan/chitin deacetylase (PgdA/CDA1 family)
MDKEIFQLDTLQKSLLGIRNLDFQFSRMCDYTLMRGCKSAYLRIDVDYDISKTVEIFQILKKLDIQATFFFRVFSPDYNACSIASIELYRQLIDSGHEIGLHHDSMVAANILDLPPIDAFLMQKEILEKATGCRVLGTASHGSRFPENNQDLFLSQNLIDLDLEYQAYETNAGGLFAESRYVSDSEWTQWKSYDHGVLIENDLRSPELHAEETDLLYILIHPDTFYQRHSFESFNHAS